MRAAEEEVRVERLERVTPAAAALLAEYYEALRIEARDDAEAMEALVADRRSGWWLAFAGEEPAGCVVLKAGVPHKDTGECKRLYVRAQFRRRRLAERLMMALEDGAHEAGLVAVYLDTNEGFEGSMALYRRLGYAEIDRYNENPQATRFFRKALV